MQLTMLIKMKTFEYYLGKTLKKHKGAMTKVLTMIGITFRSSLYCYNITIHYNSYRSNLLGLCSFIMSDAISATYSSQSIGGITCLLVKGYLYPSHIRKLQNSYQKLCGAIFTRCVFEEKLTKNSKKTIRINEWHYGTQLLDTTSLK